MSWLTLGFSSLIMALLWHFIWIMDKREDVLSLLQALLPDGFEVRHLSRFRLFKALKHQDESIFTNSLVVDLDIN